MAVAKGVTVRRRMATKYAHMARGDAVQFVRKRVTGCLRVSLLVVVLPGGGLPEQFRYLDGCPL